MSRIAASIRLLLLGATLSAASALAAAGTDTKTDFHPYRLIVRFAERDPIQLERTAVLSGMLKAQPLFPDKRSAPPTAATFKAPVYLLYFEDEQARLEAELALAAAANVEYVERDYRVVAFSDPLFSQQWNLKNEGQEYWGIERITGANNDRLIIKSGAAGADIARPNLPDPETGHHKVLLAITDTGVDYLHPDLKDNIWTNVDEIANNGLDDDYNGYVDDYHGYDFSGDSIINYDIVGDSDPSDDVGHGTHVAGICAAVSGNNIGVEGIAENVEVMCLKIFPNAFASISSQAIIYAVENGAKVINASWGTPYFSSLIQDATEFASESGVLLVAASGNSGDNSAFYPAALEQSITVGATNSLDQVTTFSTYGRWIDLVAPGRDILSLRAAGTDIYAAAGEPQIRIIEDMYYLADGTSMAAPHVAGAAAHLWSVAPGISSDSIAQLLAVSADDYLDPYQDGRSLPGKDVYSGYGRLNLGRARGLLSGGYLEIRQPLEGAIASGTFEITGSAVSQGNVGYLLEAKPASYGDWITIAEGDADLVSSTLAAWDSSPYDGRTELRLSNANGLSFRRFVRLVNSPQVEILSPQSGDTVISATAVIGSAWAPGFNDWRLDYHPDANPSHTYAIASSSELVYAGVLTDWKVGPIRPGAGVIELTVHASDFTEAVQVPIVITSLLSPGYPLKPNSRPALNWTVGNFDSDAALEAVTGSREAIIVNHLDEQRLEYLTPDFGTSYLSTMAAFDFDNNGIDEIVAVSDSGVIVVDNEGNPLPGWPKYITTGNLFNELPTPLVTDIDTDGEMEVLVINQAGIIYCWHHDGSSYFATTAGVLAKLSPGGLYRTFGASYVPFLFAYDFNGDGFEDVGALYGARAGQGGIYLVSGKNGQPLYPGSGALVRPIINFFGGLLADFDNDGEPEIACTHWYDNTRFLLGVTICEADGSALPGWPKLFPDKSNWFAAYPAAADLDGDSLPELIANFSAADGGECYVWHGDGSPLLETDFGPSDGLFATVHTSLASPVVADVDADGEAEIIARGGNLLLGMSYEHVFAWKLDGSPARLWPVYTYALPYQATWSPFTPVVADLDADQNLELLMNASDQHIYAWDLPTVDQAGAVLWGSYLRDNRNSGLVPPRRKPEPPAGTEPPLPRRTSLSQNYPNPFNGSTVIDVEISVGGRMTLAVYNILGQRVDVLCDRFYGPGNYQFKWDGSDEGGNQLASGVYFYRLRINDLSECRKMLYLK